MPSSDLPCFVSGYSSLLPCHHHADTIRTFLTNKQTNKLYRGHDRCCHISSAPQQAKLALKNVRQTVGNSKTRVKNGLDRLREIRTLLAEDANQSSNSAATTTTTATTISTRNPVLDKCFDPYVYRPLVGSSPIRKVAFKTPSEAVDVLMRIFDEVGWAVCTLLTQATSLGKIRRLLERISMSSVNILSRSLIVLNLYFDNRLLGQHSLTGLVAQDIAQLSAIPESVLTTKLGRAFLNRLAKPIYDTLRLEVLNRNRQRTYLEEVMLAEWASLQQEAHGVDASIQAESKTTGDPSYFTHYVMSVTLRLMDLYVALGVELQLVTGPHDLSVSYWYRNFLISTQLSTLSVMLKWKAAALLQKQVQTSQEPTKGATPSAPSGPSSSSSSSSSRRGKKKGKSNGQSKKGNTTNVSNSAATGGAGAGAAGSTRTMAATEEDILDDIDFMQLGLKRGLCRGAVRVRHDEFHRDSLFCVGLSIFVLPSASACDHSQTHALTNPRCFMVRVGAPI